MTLYKHLKSFFITALLLIIVSPAMAGVKYKDAQRALQKLNHYRQQAGSPALYWDSRFGSHLDCIDSCADKSERGLPPKINAALMLTHECYESAEKAIEGEMSRIYGPTMLLPAYEGISIRPVSFICPGTGARYAFDFSYGENAQQLVEPVVWPVDKAKDFFPWRQTGEKSEDETFYGTPFVYMFQRNAPDKEREFFFRVLRSGQEVKGSVRYLVKEAPGAVLVGFYPDELWEFGATYDVSFSYYSGEKHYVRSSQFTVSKRRTPVTYLNYWGDRTLGYQKMFDLFIHPRVMGSGNLGIDLYPSSCFQVTGEVLPNLLRVKSKCQGMITLQDRDDLAKPAMQLNIQ